MGDTGRSQHPRGLPCASLPRRGYTGELHPLLTDTDVLKHVYSFLNAGTIARHMVVCRDFMRGLSPLITHIALSPSCAAAKLFLRFESVTHVKLVNLRCSWSATGVSHTPNCSMDHWCDALPTCARLEVLDLSLARPCDAAMDQLCLALPRSPRLREINLDGLLATPRMATALYEALERCPALDAIHMSMVSACMVKHALIPRLCQYKKLRELDLSLNGLGPAGAELLRQALPLCAQLEVLSLASNNLEDAGIIDVAHALPRCKHLVALNLAANGMGPQGAISLAAFLPACTALRRLLVAMNSVGATGIRHLAQALPLTRCVAAEAIPPPAHRRISPFPAPMCAGGCAS